MSSPSSRSHSRHHRRSMPDRVYKRVKYQKRRKETPAEYLKRNAIREHREVQRITRLLIDRYGAKCAICGKEIRNKKDLTLDHIKPLSKGGLTTLENCQLACRKCNSQKGDKWDGDI